MLGSSYTAPTDATRLEPSLAKPNALPPSVFGRAIESAHWDGIAGTKGGGQGWEKVLTAEVFQLLDWLPRTLFLGNVLRGAVGARDTILRLAEEVEGLEFELNPGDRYLADEPPPGCKRLPVQPDGIMSTASVYCIVEAKRIRRGSFNPQQLTKEYLAVLKLAAKANRRPLLLLVVAEPKGGREGTVPVQGRGRTGIKEEIVSHLDELLPCTELGGTAGELAARIDSVVAYTTWTRIDDVAALGLTKIGTGDRSIDDSVKRLAKAVRVAIDWHGLDPQVAAPSS
jgi:hypothetical protein